MALEAAAAELEQLRNVDVFGRLGYEPTPKLQIFHEATEFDVLFGGSSGGGKPSPWSPRRSASASAIRASGSARSAAPTRS